ncbi:MAG: hypothetical protein ACRD2W_24020 [Acidimicrobiales bacterium]
MGNDQPWSLDELTVLKAVLGLVAGGACLALTILYAGWFLFIFGPLGAVLLVVGLALVLLTHQESLTRAGLWLAVVGGVLVSGPLLYFVIAVA